MATRSRTLLFLNLRASFVRSHAAQPPSAGFDHSEHAALIQHDPSQPSEVAVELAALPPRWVDIVDEIEEDIKSLKDKLSIVENAYKKHVLPGFDDRIGDEQSIERLTSDITNRFQTIQTKIKRLHSDSRDPDKRQTQSMSKNIQSSLAMKLHELSTSFRKTQSSYLRKLRGREAMANASKFGTMEDPDDEDLDAVFMDAQLAVVVTNERAISERERQINELAKSIMGLAEVFKEIQTMVVDQGTVLDRIDYNIEQTNIALEDAHRELVKASQTQNNKLAKYCIVILLVIVVIMVIVLWWKIASKRR